MKVQVTYTSTVIVDVEVPDDLNISIIDWLNIEPMPLKAMAEAEWVIKKVKKIR